MSISHGTKISNLNLRIFMCKKVVKKCQYPMGSLLKKLIFKILKIQRTCLVGLVWGWLLSYFDCYFKGEVSQTRMKTMEEFFLGFVGYFYEGEGQA